MNLSRSVKKLLGIICAILLCASFSAAAAAKNSTHKPAAKKAASSTHSAKKSSKGGKSADAHTSSKKSRKSSRTTAAKKPRGQQAIDDGRAREIQQALIRAGYLEGEPSGTWDQRTREAMTRYQNDNGWQTKIIPDSRALIKLGLGPKHANLLDAESLDQTLPYAAREVRPGGGTPQR